MIPEGRYCPQLWHKEYDGWLMAASGDRRNKVSVNHICMDKGFTVVEGPLLTSPTLEIVKVQTGQCNGVNCRTLANSKNVPCIVCSFN